MWKPIICAYCSHAGRRYSVVYSLRTGCGISKLPLCCYCKMVINEYDASAFVDNIVKSMKIVDARGLKHVDSTIAEQKYGPNFENYVN